MGIQWGQRRVDILSLCGSYHFRIFAYPLVSLVRANANYSCQQSYADDYIEASSQPYRTHLFMLDFSASSILFDNNVSFSFIKCLFSL